MTDDNLGKTLITVLNASRATGSIGHPKAPVGMVGEGDGGNLDLLGKLERALR